MTLNRRHFIGTTAGAAALLSAPGVMGQGRPKVVVIGGGAGGATAARQIALDSEGAIDVTLIEPTRTYYTCFFSNLYIGGLRDLASIAHSYGTLASDYGINIVHDYAINVDRDAKTVALAGGGRVPYDRLIMSPGIDFVDGAVPGWDLSSQNKMPHAYKGGSQTELLKAQIATMPEGGVFSIISPPHPYRCPPGPYERVSMVAHVLKQSNPTAKIMIIDAKENFPKQDLFEEGWNTHYPTMIERLGPDFGGDLVSVNPETMEIDVDGLVEKVDVCNVIPAMKAGRIAEVASLTNEAGWAPVIAKTMQSRMDDNIHVLGDAAEQGDMPKSGVAANSQAKACAVAVRAALTGSSVTPATYTNTCWSLIAPGDSVKIGGSFEATDEKIQLLEGFVSQVGEDAAIRKQNYEESVGWYAEITGDMFG